MMSAHSNNGLTMLPPLTYAELAEIIMTLTLRADDTREVAKHAPAHLQATLRAKADELDALSKKLSTPRSVAQITVVKYA